MRGNAPRSQTNIRTFAAYFCAVFWGQFLKLEPFFLAIWERTMCFVRHGGATFVPTGKLDNFVKGFIALQSKGYTPFVTNADRPESVWDQSEVWLLPIRYQCSNVIHPGFFVAAKNEPNPAI